MIKMDNNAKNPLILDGRVLAKEIRIDLRKRVAKIIEKTGEKPVLATILVGDYPPSVQYVESKGKDCERIGMSSLKVHLPETSTTEEVINEIEKLNANDNVSGILLQHPVPGHIDEQKCFNSIAFSKDTDGVNIASFGAMAMGLDGFKCATALAIMSILKRYEIETSGKNAVVIGRSPILGKPVAMLLLNADATVTICHTKTKDLPEITRRADILVAAVGKPKFVQAEWVRDGAVLIDAGYNEGDIGDIDLEAAAPKSSAYTPVPGGVGPVTRMKLIEQTVIAAERKFYL